MNYQQEAEKIVEMFRPLCAGYPGGKHERQAAIECAIIHVNGILNALDNTESYISELRYQDYVNILTELKKM